MNVDIRRSVCTEIDASDDAPELRRIHADLAALEFARDLRRVDNIRLGNAACAARQRGEIPTAQQLGAYWWDWTAPRLLEMAPWSTERGVA